MTYFQIDLNRSTVAGDTRRYRRHILALAGLGAGFLLVAVLSLSDYARLAKKTEELAHTRARLRSRIEAFETTENYVSEQDVYDLLDLTGNRVFWAKKLNSLSHILDSSMALTEMEFTNDILYLRGIIEAEKDVNRFPSISAFIDSLKQTNAFARDFPRIEFSSSERVTFAEKEIMNFEVACYR